MKVEFLGVRGSSSCSHPDFMRYGCNTSCVRVVDDHSGECLILDGGTGLENLCRQEMNTCPSVLHILLSHMHLDHIIGLPFFAPFYDSKKTIHIYAQKEGLSLKERLKTYFAHPLFPVSLHQVPAKVYFHDIDPGVFRLGSFEVTCDWIEHPGKALGFRIQNQGRLLAYIPDHEIALDRLPQTALIESVDMLIHDAYFFDVQDYQNHKGWGHSLLERTILWAEHAGVKQLVPFHYNPKHNDVFLDQEFKKFKDKNYTLKPSYEGLVIKI